MLWNKIGKQGRNREFKLKNWVAYILFFAIIVVFALWGVSPRDQGDSTGGVAAIVNGSTISIAEYRSRVENIERNAQFNLNQFPEPQRRMFMEQMRKRALDELVMGELMYQAASQRGVIVTDEEIKEYILQIPFLRENDRFMMDRYNGFLRNMGLTAIAFEKQIRKQLVTQKLQELFVAAAVPSSEELKRNSMLSGQKVNLRFLSFSSEDLMRPGIVPEAKVKEFLARQMGEVQKYYEGNPIEFSSAEKVKARHILVSIDEKTTEAQAKKKAEEIRAQATLANFSELAKKHSSDPGSKDNGGDLGEFERGRMVPEFENAAFTLEPGKISELVKTNFGYHILLVDKKTPARKQPLSEVQAQIARKLYARAHESEIRAQIKAAVESGDKKTVDSWAKQAGLNWNESGEFNLAAASVPKLGDSPEVIEAVMKQGKKPGVVPHLIEGQGRFHVLDLVSWKEEPTSKADPSELDQKRMLAYKKSSELLEAWAKEIQASAKIQLNQRITR